MGRGRVYYASMFKTTSASLDMAAARSQRWAGWIRQMGKGDIEALGALYDESSTVLFPLVLQILPDRQLAEDMLVEIYNHVREQARKFSPRKQTAVDWLISLARDYVVERLRQSNPERSLNPLEDPFKDKREQANLAVAQLPEEQRCVLEMTYLAGLSVDEVAGRLGVSREYVAKQIVFAMRTLRTFSQKAAEPAAERSLGSKESGARLLFFAS